MSASDGKPLPAPPQVAVADISRFRARYLTGFAAADESGSDNLQEVEFEDFLKVMFGRSNYEEPWRLLNPFTYRKRVRNHLALSACPTFFKVDDEQLARFNRLRDASFGAMRGRAFFDQTQFQVYGYQSRKGYGGGTNVLHTSPMQVKHEAPPYSLTNLPCIGFTHGTFGVWFTPSFVVVISFSSPNPGRPEVMDLQTFGYQHLTVSVTETSLITGEGPYAGEDVLGTTWQYVNKDGGPDRRYSYNQQLAVIRIWELDLHSDEFHLDMQFSMPGSAQALGTAIKEMRLSL